MLSSSVRIYHELFETLEKPSLYSAPWWLDTVCGAGKWDVAIQYSAEGKPQSALPYHFTRIRGLSALITPPITQWVAQISTGKENPEFHPALLHALPKTSILDLSIKPDSDLLFEDPSFPVQLKYSFILPRTDEIHTLIAGYNEGLRRNLRQAEKNYECNPSVDTGSFITLCLATYHQRRIKPPPWLEQVIPRVLIELTQRQRGMLNIATCQGKTVAGILTAWDTETSYYLAGGRTGDEQGASAHAYLLDQAIREAQARGSAFDFEGSMQPGIANFFQSFGAVPQPYWQIRKFQGIGKLWSVLHGA